MSPKGSLGGPSCFVYELWVSFGGLGASFFGTDHALDRGFSIDSFGMVLGSGLCWFVVVSGDPGT